MLLFVLAYLGGILTIASPCIIPVLPLVFAQAGRPFARSGLPMLVGMAVTLQPSPLLQPSQAARRLPPISSAGMPA